MDTVQAVSRAVGPQLIIFTQPAGAGFPAHRGLGQQPGQVLCRYGYRGNQNPGALLLPHRKGKETQVIHHPALFHRNLIASAVDGRKAQLFPVGDFFTGAQIPQPDFPLKGRHGAAAGAHQHQLRLLPHRHTLRAHRRQLKIQDGFHAQCQRKQRQAQKAQQKYPGQPLPEGQIPQSCPQQGDDVRGPPHISADGGQGSHPGWILIPALPFSPGFPPGR